MASEAAVEPLTPTITRRSLPRVRRGYRIDVSIGGTPFKVTVNVVDNRPGDVHLEHAKHGSFGHGMTSAVSLLLSEGLRHGIPLDEIVEHFIGTRFEPCGFTDDPDIRRVSSPMDYLVRRLAIDFLPHERQVTLGAIRAPTA